MDKPSLDESDIDISQFTAYSFKIYCLFPFTYFKR